MNKPIQVGHIKEKRKAPKSHLYYTYKDVKTDLNGWAKSADYLPEEFELCVLQTDKGKFLSGWHTGQHWDGLNVQGEHNVEFWKRQTEKRLDP